MKMLKVIFFLLLLVGLFVFVFDPKINIEKEKFVDCSKMKYLSETEARDIIFNHVTENQTKINQIIEYCKKNPNLKLYVS